jgi:hypothetical protein
MVLSGPVATLPSLSQCAPCDVLPGSLMKFLYARRYEHSKLSNRVSISEPTRQHCRSELILSLSNSPYIGLHLAVLLFLGSMFSGPVFPGDTSPLRSLRFTVVGNGTTPGSNSGLLLNLSSRSIPCGSFKYINASSNSSRNSPAHKGGNVGSHQSTQTSDLVSRAYVHSGDKDSSSRRYW